MDVARREDALLDEISTLIHRRDAAKAWIDLYLDANLLDADVASHLWEVLNGWDADESVSGTGSEREIGESIAEPG